MHHRKYHALSTPLVQYRFKAFQLLCYAGSGGNTMITGDYLRLASEALRAVAAQACDDAREAIERSRALLQDRHDAHQRMHAALADRRLWQAQHANAR